MPGGLGPTFPVITLPSSSGLRMFVLCSKVLIESSCRLYMPFATMSVTSNGSGKTSSRWGRVGSAVLVLARANSISLS